MRIYIFYTENIKYLLDMLIESAKGIQNTEFIPVLHDKNYENCELGKLDGAGYLEMCLQNHLTKLEIMKKNLNSNIMLIDADIVFNNKLNFVDEVNNLLVDNDFLFQYDSNSVMSNSINLGIIAVKCTNHSINFWKTHCDIISNIDLVDRRPGYPQIEFNNLIGNEIWRNKVSFKILPETFGFPNINSYCYHAISTYNKKEALEMMLNKWKN